MNIALALLFILQLHSIQLQPHDGIDILLNGNSNSNQNNAQTRNDEKSIILEENESKIRNDVILTEEDKLKLQKIFQKMQKAHNDLHELTAETVKLKLSVKEQKKAIDQLNGINFTLSNFANLVKDLNKTYQTSEYFDERLSNLMKKLERQVVMKTYKTNTFKEHLPIVKDRLRMLTSVDQYLHKVMQKQIKVISVKILLEDAMQQLLGVRTNDKIPENVQKHLNESINELNKLETQYEILENVEKQLKEFNLTMTNLWKFIDDQPTELHKLTPIFEDANKMLNEAKFHLNGAIVQMNMATANSYGIYTMNENLETVMKQLNEAMAQMNGGIFSF
uniref:SJCHGC02493 protein n=1 Tax=Schistosoma japonicum TaxID=6182 RepID=Q5DA64_SCHJA|nr:SJCHGC02493 protein [Schistosoma japonicum]